MTITRTILRPRKTTRMYHFFPQNIKATSPKTHNTATQRGFWGASKNLVLTHQLQDSNQHVRTQSCLTLCDPMDYSPSGSSVHAISQARMLESVAMSSCRGSSQPRDQNCISCISCTGRQILYHWATGPHENYRYISDTDIGLWGCLKRQKLVNV